MARDTPIEKGAYVFERVGAFARGLDRVERRRDVVMGHLIQRLSPFEMAVEGSLDLVEREGPQRVGLVLQVSLQDIREQLRRDALNGRVRARERDERPSARVVE